MKAITDPKMFDTYVEFAGIRLKVDRIDRARTDDSDNVMPVFWEEQPVTWDLAKPFIGEALAHSKGQIGFADVGTGSGVFSILVATHFPGTSIVAIDKSRRAIRQAKQNAALNGVGFELKEGLYVPSMLPTKGVKVVGLYPPYHLYPESVVHTIPQHARGGPDGQAEFRNQLAIAGSHLAEAGILFFNQMAIGTAEGPEFLEYIPQLIPGASVTYVNVFAPMSTREFLQGVYGRRHSDYVQEMAERGPVLYYCVGIVRKDGLGQVSVMDNHLDMRGRTWLDRILLHKAIAAHEGQ